MAFISDKHHAVMEEISVSQLKHQHFMGWHAVFSVISLRIGLCQEKQMTSVVSEGDDDAQMEEGSIVMKDLKELLLL